MLSQTFFVKVANGLQAKVPLHPGCIYTFEPVPEAGPYDERNKSYLQLVENTAGPPGGDGIFRVIASRGVVTIQRDEYTPVALNSFIDRCDPNADVSYGPSGRPFPFEKVTPVKTTNPRHPYALCLKKLEAELDYFYPGARVELDHIVNVAAATAAAAAQKAAAAAPPAAAVPAAAASPPVAGGAAAAAAPQGGAAVAPPLPPNAARLKVEVADAIRTRLFSSGAVYAGLEAPLAALSDAFLATTTPDRTTLLVEAFGLIKELQEYNRDGLLAPFVAGVASVFRSAREDSDTEFGKIKAEIDGLLERIDGAKRFQLKKDLVDSLRQSVSDAGTTVQDPAQPYGQTILAARDSAALDLTEVDAYINTFKANIVTELLARARSVFGSDDSASQLKGITESIDAYDRYKIFSKELNPDETAVDEEYAKLRKAIKDAREKIKTDVTAVWNATRGRCDNENAKKSTFITLAGASLKPCPSSDLDAAEEILGYVRSYCNYTEIGDTYLHAVAGPNSIALNAMALAKALNENPYAMFAMPNGFRTQINESIKNRTEIVGLANKDPAFKRAFKKAREVYGGWTLIGNNTGLLKQHSNLGDLPEVPGVTAA